MPRPVCLSTLTAVTLALALPIAGCGGSDSVIWLAQLGESSTDAEVPFELSAGKGFLVKGYTYRSLTAGDGYPMLARLAFDGEIEATTAPPMARLQLDPAPNDQFAFSGRFLGDDKPDLIGLMDEDGNILSSMEVQDVSFAHASPEGGFYVLGAVSTVSANEDTFAKKLDAEGKEIWAHHWNQHLYNRTYDAVFRGDGGAIVTGVTSDSFPVWDSFLTRLGPDGDEIWSLAYPNTSILDIEEDPDTGTLYLTGYKGNDILIGAVDQNGQEVFWKVLDGSAPEHAYEFESGWSVSVRRAKPSAPAEILVGGGFADEVDFGLDEPLRGSDDAFLLALDPTGEPLWQMPGSSEGDDFFRARYASDGNILATLTFSLLSNPTAERHVHVGGRTFDQRGITDSAVMKIAR